MNKYEKLLYKENENSLITPFGCTESSYLWTNENMYLYDKIINYCILSCKIVYFVGDSKYLVLQKIGLYAYLYNANKNFNCQNIHKIQKTF